MTPRRLTEQAVERALAARRLTIEAGSVSSGHFVTAPAALDPSELPVLVMPSDAASGVAWARAEYRLEMRLSIAPSGLMTSALRVHIRAWPSGAPGAAGAEPDGTPLGSNRALEERFMRAVGTELERVAHLFPPETEDSKESEPPAGSRQPPK